MNGPVIGCRMTAYVEPALKAYGWKKIKFMWLFYSRVSKVDYLLDDITKSRVIDTLLQYMCKFHIYKKESCTREKERKGEQLRK